MGDPFLSYHHDGRLKSIVPKPADAASGLPSYKVYKRKTTPAWHAVDGYFRKCFPEAAEDAPFDTPMKLVFNIAVGGYGGAPCSWGGPCGSACGRAIGSEMIISDISVWEMS